MAKVYVSSTFVDLEECRRQVSLVLRRMNHEDVAMEYYTARDQRPIDKCLEDVAACDLYVGIFAWRYGWIPPDNNPDQVSITEMEYRQAARSGKECLIFLLHEDAPWPRKFIDRDPLRIEQLRAYLSDKHLCAFFKSAEDIGSVVGPAIYQWAKKYGHISPGVLVPEFDLDAYYAALKKRYQRIDLEGLTPPQKEEYLQLHLRSIFVEQSVRENPPPVELSKESWERLRREKEIHQEDLPQGAAIEDIRQARTAYYEKPLRPVLDVLTDSRHQHAIILGDPGSGKSTLARYVLLSLIDSAGDEKIRRAFDGCLPILVELRSYAGLLATDKCNTFLEFLEYVGQSEGWHITANALHQHLKNDGRAVVIFDGLDEIFVPEDRERISRQIVGFVSDYPKARIIATSRVIGYRRKILSDADFSHFTLQDLDEAQVAAFVSRWYDLALSDRPDEAKEKRERILRSFKESASIRQLAGNPMLLTIMAIIGKHQELPRERWKLYDHAASVLIEHWDVNKHLRDRRVQAEFIGEEERKEMLRRLAYRMQRGAGGLAGNYIHREELQSEFESYLKDRYEQPPDLAATIVRALIDELRERNFILSLFGANLYGFVHRAFLEYFCASAFVSKFEKTQEMTLEELKRDVYVAHWEDRSWHEVLRLICGMIDEKFAGEIIDCLMNVADQPRPDEYNNRPPWNIALAVQCLSEVRNPGTVAESARRLLKVVCSLFDYVDPIRVSLGGFLEEQIATSAEMIGPNWPHRMMLVNWLNDINPGRNALFYNKAFGKLAGSVGAGLDEIHNVISDYATHSDAKLRFLAPFTLAKGWRDDPQTLLILLDRAVNDADENVRRATISALGDHYRDDPQTLILLLDRATNDTSQWVRSSAISALGDHYRDDPQALPILLDRAVNDASEDVRSSAISALGEHYRDDPQALSLLLDRAVNDASEWVRRVAISALAEHYRDDPQTLSLLLDRAVNDKDKYVRSDAISALDEHYRDQPQALPILLDRAVNDADEDVRSSAISTLGEHYRDDPQALSLLLDRAANDTSQWVRRAAISTLGDHYRDDPQTLPILLDRAVNDADENVRSDAISALGDHYRDDPQALPILLDRAVNDADEDVRSSAISTLGEHYRDDPQALSLLLDRAANDTSQWVRRVAISALGEHYRDQPQTLPLLLDRAVNDKGEYVRSNAISALDEHFRDQPQTFLILLDRATIDEDEDVRNIAVSALARHFRNDSQIFPLLLRLARGEHDAGESTRVKVIQKLVRWWQDDPETLPLIDSLSSDSNPESLRDTAKEAGMSIRRHRLACWMGWLNGIADETRFAQLPPTAEGFPVILARAVRLRNIRAFADEQIALNVTGGSNSRPLTLILGDNAAGKSTLLRCITLAALGPEMANQVEKRPDSFLRHGAERGWIEVSFQLQLDPVNDAEALGTFCIGLEIRKGESSFRAMEDSDLGQRNAAARLDWLRRQTIDRFGFVCGYGALRSLADNPSALLPEEPKEVIERVISLFRSTSSLMDPDVLSKMLAGDLSNFRTAPPIPLADDVRKSMALHLLKMLPDVGEINSGQSPGVMLNGIPVPMRDLSDGYSSLLALIGHLFRHALSARNWKADPAQVFGMALVDEIDLHLHPAWQRRVVPDLRRVFPNLQIIGTSHSAMVAGSVATDSILVLRRTQERLCVITDLPSVEGWRADQILTSLLFDLPTTRDAQTENLFSTYANLLNERGPEDEQVRELGKRVAEAMSMQGEGVVDKYTHELLKDLLRKHIESLSPEEQNQVLTPGVENQILAKTELMLSEEERKL